MKVLITDYDFPDIDLELGVYREAGIEARVAQCRTEADLIEAATGCNAILAQYVPVNAKVFAARPEIRVVSRMGAGYDTVNLEDARRFGVWVANSPDYGVGEVATHALAMALGSIRHLAAFDRDVKAGRWHYTSTGTLRRPSELTLGILGLGRIGKRMAQLSQHVFKAILACDPYIPDSDFPPYVKRVTREPLLAQSDVLSLHVPLTPETRGMANAAAFAAMKPGAWLVNTARGAVVDVDALLAALDAGRLEGAALDVLPKEPPEADHPVVRHPRVMLSPHAAFYSGPAEREMRTKAARNLVDWARTGRPTYVVVEGRNEPAAPPPG